MEKEIHEKKGVLNCTIKLDKDEVYKIHERKGRFSINIFKQPQVVSGYTSMCEDHKHILMLDYDNICKWIVLRDLNYLVEQSMLSPFYLFTTHEEEKNGNVVGNYHAVCLTKMHPAKILFMQQLTHCDNAYRTMPLRNIYRSWVLRLSGKDARKSPTFLSTVGSTGLDNPISSAHLKLLENMYDLPQFKYSTPDNLKKIFMNTYETGA